MFKRTVLRRGYRNEPVWAFREFGNWVLIDYKEEYSTRDVEELYKLNKKLRFLGTNYILYNNNNMSLLKPSNMEDGRDVDDGTNVIAVLEYISDQKTKENSFQKETKSVLDNRKGKKFNKYYGTHVKRHAKKKTGRR